MRPDIEEFRPVSQRASESCPPRSTSSSYSEITPPPVNGEPLGTSKRQELYSIRASFNEQFFHDAARMSPVFQGTLNAYTSSLEAALSAETKKNEKLAQDLIETKTLYIAALSKIISGEPSLGQNPPLTSAARMRVSVSRTMIVLAAVLLSVALVVSFCSWSSLGVIKFTCVVWLDWVAS